MVLSFEVVEAVEREGAVSSKNAGAVSRSLFRVISFAFRNAHVQKLEMLLRGLRSLDNRAVGKIADLNLSGNLAVFAGLQNQRTPRVRAGNLDISSAHSGGERDVWLNAMAFASSRIVRTDAVWALPWNWCGTRMTIYYDIIMTE